MTHYCVPVGEGQSELVIKNSVFVGTVGPATTAADARSFIAQVAELYSDANHNAWAYKIDPGPSGEIGSSDDDEPGGTAGRPMLAVLEGSGLCQVVAVVTRYFGGVKLGTGGLVRAYGGAVRQALTTVPSEERRLHHMADITIDYAQYGHLRYLLPQYEVVTRDTHFADAVTLSLAIPHTRLGDLAETLRELSNGQVTLDQDNMVWDYM